MRAIAGDPDDVQIMYAAGPATARAEVTTCPGTPGRRRAGRQRGIEQHQGDVLGEVMVALAEGREGHLGESSPGPCSATLVNELAEHWQAPDNGLWEIRGTAAPLHPLPRDAVGRVRPRHRGLERLGLEGPVERWRSLRDAVRARDMEEDTTPSAAPLSSTTAPREVDACSCCSQSGSRARRPALLGTVARGRKDLLHDGLLLRYRTDRASTARRGRASVPGLLVLAGRGTPGRSLDEAHD